MWFILPLLEDMPGLVLTATGCERGQYDRTGLHTYHAESCAEFRKPENRAGDSAFAGRDEDPVHVVSPLLVDLVQIRTICTVSWTWKASNLFSSLRTYHCCVIIGRI